MKKNFVAVIAALLSVMACTQSDPVKSFEEIVSKCDGAFKARKSTEVLFIESTHNWVKRLREPVKLIYDVKKTESLVSPFVGVIKVYEPLYYELSDSEASVNLLQVSASSSSGGVKESHLKYAMKSDKWVLEGWEIMSYMLRTPDGRLTKSSPLKLDANELAKEASPISACVP